jgi:hypothetical protein
MLMRNKLLPGICLVFFLITATLWADNSDDQKLGIKFSGYTYIEAGEVVKGIGFQNTDTYDHRWISDACVGIFASTRIDEHLKVLMGFEGQLAFPFNSYTNDPDPALTYSRALINSFWVSQGEGIYTFGDTTRTSLQIEAGYFPYKYNHEVRNLGEYLFRTYCYPPIMLNLFDRTFTELMGFRVGNTLGGVFHHDLILNSEVKQYPFLDFSLSYLADLKNPKLGFIKKGFITLGGGLQFYRLIQVQQKEDYPHGYNNANLISSDTIGWHYDSLTQTNQPVINEQWMGFPGTKVMGRATVDIKSILPDFITDFMGEEDLKAYGELAILGLKNYDKFFTDRKQRTPFTLGFNFPTFKLLDILNAEIEYLDSPYWNSTYEPIANMVPIQYTVCDTSTTYKHTKLKWSVYAKKTIGKRMSLMAQVANDHFIPKSSNAREHIQDYNDVTLRHGDWWWNFRARFDY